jgi:hypothetical protein
MCPAATLVDLDVDDVQIADCNNAPLTPPCVAEGSVLCDGELGDCLANGGVDLFDVLHTIDLVLQRFEASAEQAVLCDVDCDVDVDIFDIVRMIDTLLERIPLPLACPGVPLNAATAAATEAATTTIADSLGAARARPRRPARRATVQQRGRTLVLDNRDVGARGLEVTLTPEGGPVALRAVRGTRRTRGFEVVASQTDPSGPVKILIVALDGATLPPGRGAVARISTRRPRGGGTLRLTDTRVVETP